MSATTSPIKKHRFDAVSLLTAEKGMLAVSIIPAIGQPDWVVPTTLILDVIEHHDDATSFVWQHQDQEHELAVHTLVPRGLGVDKIIILEGNDDAERLAIQTIGDITSLKVRISDVKDARLDDEEKAHIVRSLPAALSHDGDKVIYQAVSIEDELFVVPDLDLIAYRLIKPNKTQ